MRKFSAFVLLGILTLVGIGGALLGVTQSDSGASLGTAVQNTIGVPVKNKSGAPNYSEYLTERTPQGSQVASLVFQAPDRLSGWLLSSGKRTYLYIIGTTEYIAVTQSAKASSPTTFFKQNTTGAQAVDPAHTYLVFWNCNPQPGAPVQACPTSRNGSVTTVTLHQGGQTETLTFTVIGKYVSDFKAVTPGGTIGLTITKVGTSSPVALPKHYQITSLAPNQG